MRAFALLRLLKAKRNALPTVRHGPRGTHTTTKEAAPKSTQSKRNPLDYPIATSLITEFTPKHHRAISMGMVSAAWYLGATVAAVVGFALCDVDGGWRLMLGSAIAPCVFLLIGRCKVPESPL